MASKYRIKIYNVLTYPRPGYTGCFICIDDMFMRTTISGATVNLISAGTASAHSIYSGSYPASAALSGQSNYWHSAETLQSTMNAGNAWWEYDFTANDVYIREYTIRTRSDAPYWSYDTPKTWALEWYDPKISSWVVINTQSGISWTQNELKTFTINFTYWAPYLGRNNLTVNSNYIFKTTESGIHVYNTSYSGIGFISSGIVGTGYYFNSIWADDDYLYIGTSLSGIVKTPMSSISGSVFNNFQPYKNYPDITSSAVLDIHGNDDYLCAVTNSGVDEINLNTGNRYYTTVSGASRCFQTASGIYYVVSGTLNAVYSLTSNWTTPDYSYNASTHSGLFNVDYMNDLHIKDGVIYLATNNGVIVIKEERGLERSSDYKRFKEI